MRRLWVALVAGLLVLGNVIGPNARGNAGPRQEPVATGGANEELMTAVPEVLRLAWENLPGPKAVANESADGLALRVENLSAEPLRVQLTAIADDGGQRTAKRRLADQQLAAGQAQSVPIDPRAFGFDPAQMPFAGQLQVIARAFAGDARSYRQTDSPPLYFQPATNRKGDKLVFYGEQALREQFRDGDFRGRSSGKSEPSDTATTRIIHGGAGVAPGAEEDEERTLEEPGTAQTGKQSAPVNQALAANSYTTCVKFQIRTLDSGVGIPNGPNAGGTEDHYLGADEGISVKARGVRVKLSRGTWEHTYDADSEGCFNWSHEATSGFALRVYGYATDTGGNYVRIHTAPNDFSSYPGQTYSILLNNVTPTPGGTNTYEVGSYDSKWTAMAALAFGLYRFHDGLSNKALHVGLDNVRGDNSSAHFGESNDHITAGRHYLRLGNGDQDADGNPTTRTSKHKFIVAHELGHALAALYYGDHDDAVNGGEPNVSASHFIIPDGCFNAGVPASSYSIDTKEWNSLGFREGFAHFIAAKIWNDQEPEGAFNWFGQGHDLERYGFGAGTNSGGRLENVCCTGSDCGPIWENAGTNGDWLRFFWDWYTNVSDSCPDRPTKLDMLKLYRQTRLNGGLSFNNYFDKMRAAAGDLNLPACLKTDRFDAYAAYNGIDN